MLLHQETPIVRFVSSFGLVAFFCVVASATPPDPHDLAKRVDAHLAARLSSRKIKPADQVDDATFVRHAYLDLIGRIPTVSEVRTFLHDKSVDKRAKLVGRLTDVQQSPALRAVAGSPFLDATDQIESLYLAAVARKPTADELAPLLAHVERGGVEGDPKKAMADIFWALINSTEFNTSH